MPKALGNAEIANIFEKMSRVLALKGQDRFRVLAYQKGAQSIRDLEQDLSAICASGKLTGTEWRQAPDHLSCLPPGGNSRERKRVVVPAGIKQGP